MADAEVIQELFAHHNPLKFKSHPKGKKLYWANRNWRSERKGWGQLRPVHTTDSDWIEIKDCLSEAPLDLDLHGDTLVRRGDLVLCTKSQEAVDQSNRRREYLANRKVEALKQGHNPVQDEVARLKGGGTEYLAPVKPEFKQEGGAKAIHSGVAARKRGG